MMFALQTRSLAAAMALLLAAFACADDWPQWRGLHGDGSWHETGLLEVFPPSGLKVSWRVEVGVGFSSPVVSGGRVYVNDSLLKKPQIKERIHCFDEATGKEIWTHIYDVKYPDWAFNPDFSGGPTCTPIVCDGRIYTLGAMGDLYCLNAAEGRVIWSKRLDQEYHTEVFTCRASPLIDSDQLFLHIGGKPSACVVSLDRNTGKELWRALDEPGAYNRPILITAGGQRQLIVWTQASVTALNPATGKTWWRIPIATTTNDANAAPVFHSPYLLVSGLMLKLNDAKPAAKTLWPDSMAVAKRVLSNTSTPLLQGEYVYSAKSSGHLVCLQAATGKQIWITDQVTTLKSGASIHPTANGDSTLLFNDRGELIRAKLTPAGYQEISRARLIEPILPYGGRKVIWPPPAFANGHVLARNDRELIRASLVKP